MKRGDRLPPLRVVFDRTDLTRYAEASGDHNPIHRDPELAREAGLPGVVVHGMLLVAHALRVFDRPERVRVASAQFLRPVVVPRDGSVEVLVDAAVAAVEEDGTAFVDLRVSVAERLVARMTAELGIERDM